MSEPSFRQFLETALDILRRECRPAFDRMVHELGRRPIRVAVGTDRFTVQASYSDVILGPDSTAPTTHVRTNRQTILDVVNARLTLADAIANEAIDARGSVAALLSFHDALLSFVAGAVRAPSFPALLARYSNPVEDTHGTERSRNAA